MRILLLDIDTLPSGSLDSCGCSRVRPENMRREPL